MMNTMNTAEAEALIRYYGSLIADFKLELNYGRVSLEKILERLRDLAEQLPNPQWSHDRGSGHSIQGTRFMVTAAERQRLTRERRRRGVTSLFTSDGLLVMLAPQFAFKPGRDAIQKHYQGIIDAGVTGITLELKNLELRGNDGVWAAGNYSVTVKDKTIQGNWFRILKRENGTWKIAMDAPPAATGSSQTPAKSK
jgi:ketosteroid isomerase-like protein